MLTIVDLHQKQELSASGMSKVVGGADPISDFNAQFVDLYKNGTGTGPVAGPYSGDAGGTVAVLAF
jgi:hypothetical protein